MSGLETLPPDQRAVLQLILVQRRGYADLAATLRLDAAAVRERAHAGAHALALPGGDDVDADTRGRVVDYLLGQQDDGERIVTFAELGASPAACRWAQELRAQLAGVASEELPEVPASATAAVTNGSGSSVAALAPAASVAASAPPAAPAPATPPTATVPAPAPAVPAAQPAPPSPPATGGPPAPAGPNGPRPSRLGGAILIGGAAVLAIVLAIVLIGGDDNPRPSASTSSAQTQTTARTQTSTAAANGQTTARTIGGAVLRASPTGGSAFGAALVQQPTNGGRMIAVEVARLPGNGAQDIYAIWLQGAAGDKFLGFVPRQVRANGTFTVSSALPRGLDLSAYSTVLVTSEGMTAVPSAPGTTVVSGPLRLAG